MKRYWLTFFWVIILAGFSIFAVSLYRLVYRPMISENQRPVLLTVDKAMSASAFAHRLEKQHLLDSSYLFLWWIRMQGVSQQLKAGVYQITPGEPASVLLQRVIRGDVLKQTFNIIAGTTKARITANLMRAPYLRYHEEDWLAIAGQFPSAEGLLLADTYHYNAGSDSKPLLELAHSNLQRYLVQQWQMRCVDLPYKNKYELLIAASILEKEASDPHERRLISGVIVNRLRKNMPLQMDPTVIYALGLKYSGKLTKQDLQADSPYNSYRYRGLPPTPIAMVSKEAIEAAAHPELTSYLYFVAMGDGKHYFSTTYEQQKQAIGRFIKRQ